MNCSICHKPVVLRPSAAERTALYGESPAHYAAIFTSHAECQLAQRYKPLKRVPVRELPAIFQEEEMGRLRRLACQAFGCGSSKMTADYVNRMTEEELAQLVYGEKQ